METFARLIPAIEADGVFMRIHSVRGADEESAANVSLALQNSRRVVRFLDAVTEWPDRGRRGILHLSACISVGMSIEVGSPAKKGITKYGFPAICRKCGTVSMKRSRGGLVRERPEADLRKISGVCCCGGRPSTATRRGAPKLSSGVAAEACKAPAEDPRPGKREPRSR